MAAIALIGSTGDAIARQSDMAARSARAVAITAEAAYALERQGCDFIPIHRIADQAQFSELAQPLFDRVTEALTAAGDRCPAMADSLKYSVYQIYYEFIGIVAGAYILAAAIAELRPDTVFVFSKSTHDLYSNVRYGTYARICSAAKITLRLIHTAAAPSQRNRSLLMRAALRNLQIVRSKVAAWRRDSLSSTSIFSGTGSVVYVGGPTADWAPFLLHARRAMPNLHHYTLEQCSDAPSWEASFKRLRRIGSLMDVRHFGTIKPVAEEVDSTISIDGLNIKLVDSSVDFSVELSEIATRMTLGAPQMVSHTRYIASQIVDSLRPRAVCFTGLTTLAERAVCDEFRRHGIPTIYYQNGGVYGTQRQPMIEEMIERHVDYFFAYGPNIQPRSRDPNEVRTTFIATGSLRLHDMAAMNTYLSRRNPRPRPLRILWMSEGTTRNTKGYWYQCEDIRRFETQRAGLSILAKNPKFDVTFRPIPSQVADLATPSWLREHRPSVTVDDYSEARYLIQAADVVICDVHSNTSWDESFICGKPFILFVDPSVTQLRDDFSSCLENACLWCRSTGEFLDQLQRLSADPSGFLANYRKATGNYLTRYAIAGTGALKAMADILAVGQSNARIPN